jgi:hypothetical protein
MLNVKVPTIVSLSLPFVSNFVAPTTVAVAVVIDGVMVVVIIVVKIWRKKLFVVFVFL